MNEKRAWYFYDWANSAFSTTVVSLFLGPYLTTLARRAAGPDGAVALGGLRIAAESVWPFSVALSVAAQVITLPVCGAVADYGRRKREMLGVLAYVGAAATTALFFVRGADYLTGCALFLVANVAFGASVVIYNSFLPEIATAEERDLVSARGWGLGYLGGALLLAANLLLYARAPALGLTEEFAVRLSLASAGAWWALFTVIPLRGLRNRGPRRESPPGRSALGATLGQLARTFRSIRRYPQTLLFLVAYLIYNDATQTVLTMAVQFGAAELKLSMATLTSAALLVQFVAFAGALAAGRVAVSIGNKRAVLAALAVWSAVLVYIYGAVDTAAEFYFAAAVVGIVMGGSQALSRSIYSFLIPRGQEAEFFAVYEISDKGTSWLGPFLFGLALQWTRSYRIAVLSLIVFFVAGMALLARVDVERGTREAAEGRQEWN